MFSASGVHSGADVAHYSKRKHREASRRSILTSIHQCGTVSVFERFTMATTHGEHVSHAINGCKVQLTQRTCIGSYVGLLHIRCRGVVECGVAALSRSHPNGPFHSNVGASKLKVAHFTSFQGFLYDDSIFS